MKKALAFALAIFAFPASAMAASQTTVTTPSGASHGSLVSGNLPKATGANTVTDSGLPSAAQGNGSKVQLSTGSTSTDHCAKFDANGNTVDAGAACDTASGTVTTTGSPSSGNLAKFSGSTSITNTDLTGAVTTSGGSATTIQTSIALPGSPTTTTQSALDNSTKIATTAYADALSAAFIAVGHIFTAKQSECVSTTTSSPGCPQSTDVSGTWTPNGAVQNYSFTLVHAECPCTLANPSTTPTPGTGGTFEIIQSSSGSDTITTWGSDYTYAGGTSTIAFSTGASDRDYLSYYVADSTHIVLSTGGLNATH